MSWKAFSVVLGHCVTHVLQDTWIALKQGWPKTCFQIGSSWCKAKDKVEGGAQVAGRTEDVDSIASMRW